MTWIKNVKNVHYIYGSSAVKSIQSINMPQNEVAFGEICQKSATFCLQPFSRRRRCIAESNKTAVCSYKTHRSWKLRNIISTGETRRVKAKYKKHIHSTAIKWELLINWINYKRAAFVLPAPFLSNNYNLSAARIWTLLTNYRNDAIVCYPSWLSAPAFIFWRHHYAAVHIKPHYGFTVHPLCARLSVPAINSKQEKTLVWTLLGVKLTGVPFLLHKQIKKQTVMWEIRDLRPKN